MKKVYLSILIIASGFLIGCEAAQVINSDNNKNSRFKLIAESYSYPNILIREIDGKEYIIVYHSHGIAICPK